MRIGCQLTCKGAVLPVMSEVNGVFYLYPSHRLTVNSGNGLLYKTGLRFSLPASHFLLVKHNRSVPLPIQVEMQLVTDARELEVLIKNISGGVFYIEKDKPLFDLILLTTPCRQNDEFYVHSVDIRDL